MWERQHPDGTLVSVLSPSACEELKVKLRGGGWIAGTAPAGYSIAQVGDMLQYLTGGYRARPCTASTRRA